MAVRRRATAFAFAAIHCIVVSTVLLENTAHAQLLNAKCPPTNAGAPGPVPGQPFESGWLIKTWPPDETGTYFQLWCLQKIDGGVHGGPEFGGLCVPGGDASESVWTGACVFPNGKNWPRPAFIRYDSGPNISHARRYTHFVWDNLSSPPDGGRDWHYDLDVEASTLTITPSTMFWSFDGGRYWPHSTLIDAQASTSSAPTNFQSMIYFPPEGGIPFQLTQASGPGVAGTAFTLSGAANGTAWAYALEVNTLGSDAADDPYVGLVAEVEVGDTFAISGGGIQNPSVSSPASDPAYGGWVVDSWDTTFVVFRATSAASLTSSTVISGFSLSSAGAAGTVDWNYSGANLGQIDTAPGPLPLGATSVPAVPPWGVALMPVLILLLFPIKAFKRWRARGVG
jgi:hypothetical protein